MDVTPNAFYNLPNLTKVYYKGTRASFLENTALKTALRSGKSRGVQVIFENGDTTSL